MAYDYSDLTAQTRQWAEQATAKGWLTESAAQQLVDFDLRTPGSLFNKDDSRPLIVAFMGGTGVGKSSLLNRLAGSAIAKAGVERPTSKEVTLFHHHSVVIAHLPEQLPLEHINIAQHNDERNKAIIWMDMPDFDSTEQANKQQVLQWLPHIDVLIYVVSPERYRDEKAWRLLLAEGGKHAWLFVINQWDRGQIEQYADFKQQLYKAGFVDPLIFTTSCAETIQTDEFAALQDTILSLATNHIVQQLEQRGLQVKTRELKQKLHDCKHLLGSEQSITQLQRIWHEQWQKTCAVLQQGFAWPIQKMAAYYGEHAADLITNAGVQPKLWDTWAQARFEDAVDEVIACSNQLQIPVSPIKKQLAVNRDKAANTMQSQTELAARQALANPGHALQRLFLKIMRFCEIVLPLAAICWVGYQVFMGFYRSNVTNTHYLGADFAIHSGLLIALTWLLPFFILKKLKPSLEASALRGLNKGLSTGLATIENDVSVALSDIVEQHNTQIEQLNTIIARCETNSVKGLSTDRNEQLNRMLVS